MSIGAHLLGRNKEHDPKSRSFAAEVRKLTRPPNVTHTLGIPHLNQADLGSCEGNTAVEFLGCAKALKNRIAYNRHDTDAQGSHFSLRTYPTEEDAVRLYSAATYRDDDEIEGHYPPKDTGTSAVGIAKAMQAYGAIERYEWTFTWTDFLAALVQRPVMLGTNWYDSMFEHDAQGYVHVNGQDPAGGHAYLAYAVDHTHRRVGCTNHWVNEDGSVWGVKIGRHQGSFWIGFDDLERLLIHEQGESLVPVLM